MKALKIAVLSTVFLTSAVVADEHSRTKATVDTSNNWNVSVTATSEYLFRGLKQTQGDPALQASIDYNFDGGLYAGAWASTVKWTEEGYMNNNDVETNFFVGYSDTLGQTGIGYDVGVLQYYYPGTVKNGVSDTDATEIYAGVNKDILGMNWAVKYSQIVSDDAWGIGDADGSQYVEANLTVPLTEKLSALAHVGRSEFDGNGNDVYDYTDWSLGAEYAVGDYVTVGAGYSDTNTNEANWTLNGEDQGKGQTLAWLTYAF